MDKAILFDMDDTMINSDHLHFEASRKIFLPYGVDVNDLPSEVTANFFGLRVYEIIEMTAKYFGLKNFDIDSFLEKREKFFLELVNKNLEPMPGLFEFIEKVSVRDFKRALASSARMEYIEVVIDKLKLDSFFQTIVSGDMVEKAKPDPTIFLKAAENLSVRPERCIVLEDSVHGIEAANRAGMISVGVENRLSEYKQDLSKADYIVGGLDKIEDSLLDSIIS